MENGFYSPEELYKLGLKSIGKGVLLSKKASLYGVDSIQIGNYVRIDDFVILSGKVHIGDYVHIGAGTICSGGDEGIEIQDYVGISSGCKILSVSDDYSGESMANPMIPAKYRNITAKHLIIHKHCLIGTTSVILPASGGLAEGVSVGALSLVMRPTKPFGIYFGIPAKRIANRSKAFLMLEQEFLADRESTQTDSTHNTCKLGSKTAAAHKTIHTENPDSKKSLINPMGGGALNTSEHLLALSYFIFCDRFYQYLIYVALAYFYYPRAHCASTYYHTQILAYLALLPYISTPHKELL